MKRGVELSMSLIVFAVLAVIVIVVVIAVFTGKVGEVAGIFSDKTNEAQKESSKISLFNGCCGDSSKCLEGRTPVGGECKNSCENKFTLPLNGWDDCKGEQTVCCKK